MQDQRVFTLRTMAALAALSLFPLAGFVALDAWTRASCVGTTAASGELGGAVDWRIERMVCSGAEAPFYDVLVGARGHAPATAATSRGAPVPLAVRRIGSDRIGVTLDRPWRGETVVAVRLRRTGAPGERIDLSGETP